MSGETDPAGGPGELDAPDAAGRPEAAEHTGDPAPADATERPEAAERTGDTEAADAAPDGTSRPRRRGYRRAVGGTRPTDQDEPEPRAPRAPEDTDTAWGERPDGDDDERILREVPPHW
ncbi:hypothetical protein OEB99_15775 [Actinotalea sp. M2MS4P-6]|uniref:hypothetical protein n=1 Tax=Actinotalea sp. M2MS4P-6 TaxID=2983762 RepID=UPI0021E46ED4|nr:hypothetical protein [Actinotalea sp. M2MS4P-6]MCV2395775.1 hypothetical protein [Actinotalea sp. M2MS4P-6]